MLISFILVAYNQARFVRQAIEGALSQTYSPLEIILSDDASEDGTFDVIREVASRFRGPHKLVLNRNERNLKTGDHFNRCMRLARGELCVLAASDDVSLPHRVQRLHQAWVESGDRAAAVMSNAIPISESGAVLAPSFYARESGTRPGEIRLRRFDDRVGIGLLETAHRGLYFTEGLLGATTALHKSVFTEFGPLTNHLYGEDEGFAFRANMLGGISYIDDCLVQYRRECGQRIPDAYPHEKEGYYQFLLEDHMLRQNLSNLHDVGTALRRGRITDAQARYFRRRFQGENPFLEMGMSLYGKRWGRLLMQATVRMVAGPQRKRTAGWLLYHFFPRAHRQYTCLRQGPGRSTGERRETAGCERHLDWFASH